MSFHHTEAFPSFDAANSPLPPGTTLLEASAGTGKTYTLTAIFLRLIATEGLEVREILVSTFTEAATRELKDRIRLRLLGARDAFAEGHSEDAVLAALLSRHAGDRDVAAIRINRAIRDLDEARISTIHGFCQRALREFALESGQPFDAELCKDPSSLIALVVRDFLRSTLHDISPTICGILGPPEEGDLRELLQLLLNKPTLLLDSALPDPSLEEASSRTRKAMEYAASLWMRDAGEIRRCLLHSGDWFNQRGAGNPAKMGPLLGFLKAWLEAKDRAAESLAYHNMGGIAALEVLTPARLEKCTLKAGVTPRHDFFNAVEALLETVQPLQTAFYRSFLEQAPAAFRTLKSERNLLGFDDLLRELQAALSREGSVALRDRLADRYRAALLDEFQDTDPVQEAIFAGLFGSASGARSEGSKRWLFLIGDPKQAIYSFRGADIHTYLAAGARAHHHYSLDTNHRSTKGLVEAVNHLFGRHPRPFILSDIGFVPVGARGLAPISVGDEEPPPFQLWLETPQKPLTSGVAKKLLYNSVAASVVETLRTARINGMPLEPSQIAVLLSANSQGPEIQKALREKGVPSVLFSDQSVFESPDARELLSLLRAVESPGKTRLVRRALVTAFLGRTAGELVALQTDTAAWERVWNSFRELHGLWTGRGFVVMFSALVQDWGIRNCLLSRPDGERRLTNLLHLGELLAAAARNSPNMPGPLLRWLEQQVSDGEDAEVEDSAKMRIESDEHAVQVLTMHASKGLEWEVVYCPFTWASGTARQYKRSRAVLPPESRGCPPKLRVDALGKNPLAAGVLAQIEPRIHREAAAEQTRLLYVAATRAKRLCHLAWGAIKEAESSGTAWLLHGDGVSSDDWEGAKDRLKQLQKPEMIAAAVDKAVGLEDGRIRVAPWPENLPDRWKSLEKNEQPLRALSFTRKIEGGWGIHSFTSLTAGAEHSARDTDGMEAASRQDLTPEDSIHSFPAGAHAGSCLHAVFENIDFTRPEDVESEVARQLLVAGFEAERWTGVVSNALKAVLMAPLDDGLGLDRVPLSKRKVELEFMLPMGDLSARDLLDTLGPEAAGRLSFDSRKGWLKGFIDLVFEHDGRFYIVDWKSNWLGAEPDAYREEGMQEAMARHSYPLQAALYSLALHRYLAGRIPGYSYGEHFGGAFYVFVRGVSPEAPGRGICRVRPSEAEISALSKLFQPVQHAD
jgi:exodeoxyribonuclease V beta subunit